LTLAKLEDSQFTVLHHLFWKQQQCRKLAVLLTTHNTVLITLVHAIQQR